MKSVRRYIFFPPKGGDLLIYLNLICKHKSMHAFIIPFCRTRGKWKKHDNSFAAMATLTQKKNHNASPKVD